MNFNKPIAENPEYKEVKKEDVIEATVQALVDNALIGANQDFIERRRPHLLADTRGKVSKTYEKYADMFENFSGDVSGGSATEMVARRAEVLTSLFEQNENIDMSVGGDVLDGKFSGADLNKDAAVFYVFQLEGTDDIGSIPLFDKKLKNAEVLIDLFKSKDRFSYDQFQKFLISGDMANAIAELENFKEKELGGGRENFGS